MYFKQTSHPVSLDSDSSLLSRLEMSARPQNANTTLTPPTPKPLLNPPSCVSPPATQAPTRQGKKKERGVGSHRSTRHPPSLILPVPPATIPARVSHTPHTAARQPKKRPKGMLRPNATFHRTSFPRRQLSGEKPPPHLPVVRRRSNTPLSHTLYLVSPPITSLMCKPHETRQKA